MSDLEVTNQFVKEIADTLSSICEVTTDKVKFWERGGNFDVLLFQWPEELFRHWGEPSQDDLDILLYTLDEWRKSSKLYIIRHNIHPHYKQTDNYAKLYDTIYSNMDGVLHMGQFSKHDYFNRYPTLAQSQKHFLVPHPLYNSITDLASKSNSRLKLKIPPDKYVILVVGAVRSDEEKMLILRSFKQLNIDRKYLLVTSMPAHKIRGFSLPPFLLRAYYKFLPNSRFEPNFISDSEIHYYLSAADVVLIPRKAPLNSGILPLAFQFKNVVVGPNFGNVGEILNLTGNPTFYFNSDVSVINALKKAEDLVNLGKGGDNYNYAVLNWNKVKIKQSLNSWIESI